ncbi:hypothetical protein PoMZ_04566 [Pyricularia oryzae]|uniref:Uncharacterized protein n=1 Tax=Pyricularia oryzae TaxID=318829 RepID=A0A4P7NDW3_PYROR|nr:hypothetical protein PoMZ_04566 [Pyricularia oryzae]
MIRADNDHRVFFFFFSSFYLPKCVRGNGRSLGRDHSDLRPPLTGLERFSSRPRRNSGGRPLVRSEETESSSTRIADARESVWRCTPTHGGEGWPRPQHYWSFTLAGWMIFFGAGAMCSEGQLPRHSRVAYEALTDDNLDANEARLQASTCLQTSSRLCKSMI